MGCPHRVGLGVNVSSRPTDVPCPRCHQARCSAYGRVSAAAGPFVGLCACGLAYLADRSLPAAVLIGGSAVGGTVVLFNTIIGR